MELINDQISLSRRLLITYSASLLVAIVLLTGACLFSGQPHVIAIAASAALLVSWLLYRNMMPVALKRDLYIRRQLADFPADADAACWDPQPILDTNAVEAGWNRMVDTARHWRLLSQLEKHLDHSLAQGNSGEFDGVINSLSEGIAVTDLENLVQYANTAFQSICESNPENCIGVPLEEILPDGISLDHFVGSTHPVTIDIEHPTPSATQYLRLSRRPQLDELGQVGGFVWILRDVTQQQLAEDAREQFVAAATHELRTPLASIRAYAETLASRDNIDREQQKRFFNTIQSEAIRLGKFIDDLLDVSRMQAGSISLDCHETDIARLINETVEKIRPAMDSKQQEFRVEIPSKLPVLKLDKGKINAALINLLGNASKYTPEGGRVSLRISVSAQRVEFSITDTGIGIAPDELQNVFNRFFRSDDERVQEISGSGLGLTFSHEVARLHGGDLRVESELNKGSTFCLTLPIGLGG